ncbi:MAG: amino acid permease [Gemmatimonadota bacterium]|nr:amino acid permease [Gemmatimonadota bacterium]
MSGTTYARRLGLFSGTLLVVGGIIGSGIFLNPAVVAQRVGTPALTIVAWGLGAVIAILGAFIFAELGARAPSAGGGYAYLRDAFGPLPAFLYGWALLLAIASGATAAVAVTFANYAAPLLGIPTGMERTLAIGAIALFSGINVIGVAPGAWVQNAFTLLKLAAIAALVVVGLGTLGGGAGYVAAPAAAPLVAPAGPFALAVALGTALVPVLFAYGGWQQTNFVAEEMVDPRRDLPRALILGVLIVAAAYVLVNLAYLRALGIAGLAASTAPAADTMALHFGDAGRTLIAVGVACSTAGFLMVVILVTPRVYQAMARDGVFFAGLATLHPRTRTPVNAILLQGGWAVALVLSGTYGELLDWVTFADWIFFGATAATLIVYRRRARTGDHFAAPFHPWSTGLFMLAALYVVLGAIVSNPANALRGSAVLAAGVPVFLWWRRSGGRPADTLGAPAP